jgi:hypothetical protein
LKMAGFKLSCVEWETDLREIELEASLVGAATLEKAARPIVFSTDDAESPIAAQMMPETARSNLTHSLDSFSRPPLQLSIDEGTVGDDARSPLKSGHEDRPHTPDPQRQPTPPRTFVQGVTWGYDVIRAVDADDPAALMESLRRKGASPNDRVGKDGYGGHRWSAWCHRMAGDTVLHLCLRWKKTKALGGLYPLALAEAAQAPDFEAKNNNSSGGGDADTFQDPDASIPLSGVFDLTVPDAQGHTANDICAALLLHGGVGLARLWLNTQRRDRELAAAARKSRRAAFEASKRAGFEELNRAHGKAREDYRLSVRQVGSLLEGDALLGQRRVLAPPSSALTKVDPEARIEARRNIWQAAGGHPPPPRHDQGGVNRADEGFTMRGRPGGKDDAFPVDVSGEQLYVFAAMCKCAIHLFPIQPIFQPRLWCKCLTHTHKIVPPYK